MHHGPRSFRALLALALPAALVAACDGAPTRTPSDVRTTGASFPDPTTLPPSSHTVDSAGAADNGGKTADGTTRSQFSGMRPTEVGGQAPTGTPGSGLPLPIEATGKTSEAERIQRQKPVTSGPPKGAPNEEVVGRLAAAWCDREQYCGRIGNGKAYGSSSACVDRQRPGVRQSTDGAACPNGFDADKVSACLTALRRAECSAKLASVEGVSDCGSLCLSAR